VSSATDEYMERAKQAVLRARVLKKSGRLLESNRTYEEAAAYLSAAGRHDMAARAWLEAAQPAKAASAWMDGGDFMEAARVWANCGELARATKIYEARSRWAEAARCREAMGHVDQAVVLWLKANWTTRAAAVLVRAERPTEALDMLAHARDAGADAMDVARVALDALENGAPWCEAADRAVSGLLDQSVVQETMLDWVRLARLLERLEQWERALQVWDRLSVLPTHQGTANAARARIRTARGPSISDIRTTSDTFSFDADVMNLPTGKLEELTTDGAHQADDPSASSRRSDYKAHGRDPAGRILAERYRLGSLLGAGAMGQVFAATHLTLQRKVAVKVLSPGPRLDDDDREALFMREARAASRIYHPNVVQVMDFGEDPELGPFLVMEYLDGPPLAQIMGEHRSLNPRWTVDVMIQVLSALEAAHTSNILHRDVKPGNIMVLDPASRRPFSKVVDFGIARALSETSAGMVSMMSTQNGAVRGTPVYMAPEQLLAEELDPRADLYAAATVLYQMLTGRLPFEANGLMKLMHSKTQEEARPAEALADGSPMPEPVRDLLTACLARERGRRPQSAAEFRLALEPYAREPIWGKR